MTLVLYAFAELVRLLVWVLFFLMFLRAVLSWFPVDEDSWLSNLAFYTTEPIIYPFRVLTDKIPFFQTFPLDIAYMLAILALILVEFLLDLMPVINI